MRRNKEDYNTFIIICSHFCFYFRRIFPYVLSVLNPWRRFGHITQRHHTGESESLSFFRTSQVDYLAAPVDLLEDLFVYVNPKVKYNIYI